MRRLSILLLGVLALSGLAFAPAPPPAPVAVADTAPEVVPTSDRQVIICVKFRDWEVPATGYTWEAPYERFCVDTPSIPGQQQ